MADVEVYTTTYCPYCVRAKQLLDRKGAKYKEIDLTNDDDGRIALVKRTNGSRTVPQIFINGQSVGGCDDLYALDGAGKLDALLSA